MVRTCLVESSVWSRVLCDMPSEQMDNPHICGRVAPLLPDEPFLGGPPVCRTCTGPEDIQDTLDRSMFNEDEQVGLVGWMRVYGVSSKWCF